MAEVGSLAGVSDVLDSCRVSLKTTNVDDELHAFRPEFLRKRHRPWNGSANRNTAAGRGRDCNIGSLLAQRADTMDTSRIEVLAWHVTIKSLYGVDQCPTDVIEHVYSWSASSESGDPHKLASVVDPCMVATCIEARRRQVLEELLAELGGSEDAEVAVRVPFWCHLNPDFLH